MPRFTRFQIVNNTVIMGTGISEPLYRLELISALLKLIVLQITRNRKPKINKGSEGNELCKTQTG